ncbi:MAG: restriction endonuclease subunit S [Candidatus Methanoperedenaceae archaeon]|nr:restriction endonuclease subunit S [Candidatus Methanoperedenaceae archaeon]
MKAYPKCKAIDIEWVKEIPEHWVLNKFSRIASYQEGPGLRNWQFTNEGIKVICVTNITESGIDFSKYSKFISMEEYNKSYKHFTVKIGDLLLSSSGASWGKVAEFNSDEIVILNTSTIRINKNENNDIIREFLKWMLQSELIKEQLRLLMTGSCQPNFGPTHLDKLVIIYPLDHTEQQKISHYLEDRTQKIDTLIVKKQKLIDLLKEERTATINQVVTKGLNPDVPMKDSGVEWLGEIPKNWKIKKMKNVADVKSSNVDKKNSDNEKKVFLCNYLDVYRNEYIDNSFSFMEATANENEIEKFIVKKGDVLVTKDSETPDDIANPAYIKEDLINTICGYHLAQIRANQIELIGEYLFRLFQSKQFNSHFEVSANGITRFGLSIDSFKLVSIPLPPIEEQNQITKYIETSTKKIHRTISRIEKEIELMKEYRTAMISEVVTGKIDVREAV